MTFSPREIDGIHGWLGDAEAMLLYRLASEVPADGVIVEIGSFQGKSTVTLGKGAKVSRSWVYAIDPHNDYMVDSQTHFGMEHHAALLKNLVEHGVADTVRVVALEAHRVAENFPHFIDLLFIDGDHNVAGVIRDFELWGRMVGRHGAGFIAFHDYTNPLWPGVAQVVNEAIATGEWELVERADATAVIRRVSK